MVLMSWKLVKTTNSGFFGGRPGVDLFSTKLVYQCATNSASCKNLFFREILWGPYSWDPRFFRWRNWAREKWHSASKVTACEWRVRQPLYPVGLMPKPAALTTELGSFYFTNSCFLHFFLRRKYFMVRIFFHVLCFLIRRNVFKGLTSCVFGLCV